MANDLEQRAREHLLAYLTHLHPEHDEAAYNAVTETVAALQQAQQPAPDTMRELRAYARGLEDAQQPGAQAVAIEPEPDLDAHDPKSGELVAQWLFRNGFHELAAVVRAQLDMRAPRKAPPPLPEGVSEEDVEDVRQAAVIVGPNGDRERGERLYDLADRLESYRARLAAKGGV